MRPVVLHITRRKQSFGFFSKLSVSTKEGNPIVVKPGQTIALPVNEIPATLYIKRFFGTRKINMAGIILPGEPTTSLELYYSLPDGFLTVLVIAALAMILSVFTNFRDRKYYPVSMATIFIILICKIKRDALSIQRLPVTVNQNIL